MSTRLPKQAKKYFKSGGAARWWGTQGAKPLGEMGKYILDSVSKEGGIALDVGAGKGSLAVPLGKLGMDVIALDISRQMLSVICARAKENALENIMFVVADAENLPFIDQGFDSVLCVETLIHLPDPDKALTEFARVARKSGIVVADVEIGSFVSLIQDKDIKRAVKSFLGDYFYFLIPRHFKERIIWKGYSKREFVSLICSSNLSLLELKKFQRKYVGCARAS